MWNITDYSSKRANNRSTNTNSPFSWYVSSSASLIPQSTKCSLPHSNVLQSSFRYWREVRTPGNWGEKRRNIILFIFFKTLKPIKRLILSLSITIIRFRFLYVRSFHAFRSSSKILMSFLTSTVLFTQMHLLVHLQTSSPSILRMSSSHRKDHQRRSPLYQSTTRHSYVSNPESYFELEG